MQNPPSQFFESNELLPAQRAQHQGIDWKLGRRILCIGLGLGSLLLAHFFSAHPELCERLYGGYLGHALPYLLSRFSSLLPFSLAECLLIVILIRQIMLSILDVRLWIRHRIRWLSVLGLATLRLAADAGFILFLFYFLWGFNYGRPPIESSWSDPEASITAEVDLPMMEALCEEITRQCNRCYLQLHDCEDAGQPTSMPIGDERLNEAIEAGYRRLQVEYCIPPGDPQVRSRVKKLWITPLLERLGISGFYFPFTGEANLNRNLPAVSAPQVVAHEKAHQKGWGPENEANFLGFLAASISPEPIAVYSASVFAQRQLLRSLHRNGSEQFQRLLEMRLPGVQRDIDDLIAYWQQHRGRSRRMARSINDAYLRSHGVEGGVLSYGRSVDLLVKFALHNGGHLSSPRTEGNADERKDSR